MILSLVSFAQKVSNGPIFKIIGIQLLSLATSLFFQTVNNSSTTQLPEDTAMNHSVSNIEESDVSRYFTADQANAMLPLVKVIVADIVRLANDLVDRKRRLDALGPVKLKRADAYSDELDQIEKTVDDDKFRLQELLEELCELGVQPKELLKGIVAFPALANQDQAFLIWKLGDEKVSSWDDWENDLTKGNSLESFFEQSQN